MFTDSSNTNVECKLAARKLISALSSRPEELMRYLNRESSVFSKTADPSVLAALRILQLFYDQVKLEVCESTEADARESETLRFLNIMDNESCRSLVSRYANEVYPKEWQEINVNRKTPKSKVPITIPSLGQKFDENAESDNASTITEKSSQSNGSKRSKRIIEVSVSSSSSSSSSPAHKLSKSSGRRHSNRPQTQQRQQADKSCSPIEQSLFESTKSTHSRRKSTHRSSLNEVADLVSQISMGVQTDAIKIDAATRTHFNNGSSLTSTPTSTSKTTSTSLNFFVTGVFRTQHWPSFVASNYRLVTIGRDGSVQPTYNMPNPLDQSTPVYRSGGRTTIRDLDLQDVDMEEERNTRRLSHGHFQQVMGSSTDSPPCCR
ncbi:hypothetical protein M3Y97_00979600 [Aphelenchoides bicaudatus]|nr:hypothetical protein M3Y97_00979600 [Aphelenchoides bicaudatus]